jgi:hypothetical protein
MLPIELTNPRCSSRLCQREDLLAFFGAEKACLKYEVTRISLRQDSTSIHHRSYSGCEERANKRLRCRWWTRISQRSWVVGAIASFYLSRVAGSSCAVAYYYPLLYAPTDSANPGVLAWLEHSDPDV